MEGAVTMSDMQPANEDEWVPLEQFWTKERTLTALELVEALEAIGEVEGHASAMTVRLIEALGSSRTVE